MRCAKKLLSPLPPPPPASLEYAAILYPCPRGGGHSHGHSQHGRHAKATAGVEVWSGLLGFLQAAQNAEIQTKQSDKIVAKFLGATQSMSKLQAAVRLIIDSKRDQQKKTNQQKPGLLPLAGACKGEDEEEPAMDQRHGLGSQRKKAVLPFLRGRPRQDTAQWMN